MKTRKRKETGVDALPEKVQKVVHSEKKEPNNKLVEGQDATEFVKNVKVLLRTQQTVLSGEVCCTR